MTVSSAQRARACMTCICCGVNHWNPSIQIYAPWRNSSRHASSASAVSKSRVDPKRVCKYSSYFSYNREISEIFCFSTPVSKALPAFFNVSASIPKDRHSVIKAEAVAAKPGCPMACCKTVNDGAQASASRRNTRRLSKSFNTTVSPLPPCVTCRAKRENPEIRVPINPRPCKDSA